MNDTYSLPKFKSCPSCKLCELHESTENPGSSTKFFKLSKSDSLLPPLIVVARQPSILHNEKTNSFGPSGDMLRRVYLNHEDLLNASIYIAHAAKCSGDMSKNKHFKSCFPYLLEDIEEIIGRHKASKSILLCLGSHAYSVISKNFLGKSQSLRHGFNNQGQPSTLLLPNLLNIYTTFSPGAVLKESKYLYPVSDHIELLAKALNGNLPTPSLPDIQEPTWPQEIS